MENSYSNLFVCIMGIGTVFIGLICIIVLVTIMSNVVRKMDRSGKKQASGAGTDLPAAAPAGPANGSGRAAPEQTGTLTAQLVAAVSAAIAQDMGTDISGFRIVSFKKI